MGTSGEQGEGTYRQGNWRGVALVASAGVFWSLQGATVRMVEEASAPQIVFWRSIAQFTAMLCVIALVNRGRVITAFRRAGGLGVIGGCCSLVAGTTFVFALTSTTVANVVFIMASSPLFAALAAWVVMRERLERRTLLAMAVALGGIGIMVSEGVGAGGMAGHLYSLAAAIGFAGIAVVARRGAGGDMLPMVCWGALFNLGAGALLAGGDVAVPLADAGACFISGGVLTAGGAICFMRGARYVPAGVLAFLSLTEIVLAPIWVWAAFDEVPSTLTLAGGAVVMTALAVEGVLRVRGR